MKLTLPAVLSLNGGFVDTAGFLSLQGLFTAHVTGNFVTFGAALVHGTTGAFAKLLALPVFCIVVVLVRLLGDYLVMKHLPPLRLLLGLKVALLALAAVLAVALGPFPDGDGASAILTGMVLVSAMAIQNAVHRIHLASAPPTTLMTGTTTQIMIDLADLTRGVPAAEADKVRGRLSRMAMSVGGFALGCGLAALLFVSGGMWCLALPPVIALAALVMREAASAEKPAA
jgi:uncharacterized membrane protein YoaK (UPF0700 family)